MTQASRLWLTGLAALFAAVITSPAAAAGAESLPDSASAVRPLPAASWHGRPIRHPQPDAAAALFAASAGRTVLGIGAGYRRPDGWAAVRRVQRLLRRIGYRCGPVDGLFGPRTRASVQWFQIKHGLQPNGVVGPRTLAFLRLRAAGAALSPRAGPSRPARAVVAPPVRARPVRHVAATHHGEALPVALAAAVALALLACTVGMWRREPRAGTDPPARPQLPSAAGAPDGAPRAVGYATGRDRGELRRRARTIERACAERGWAVAGIVGEGLPGGADAKGRPGLAFAIERLGEEGEGSRFVASRLEDVGRTRRDLAAVLAWCARSRVALLALDVGLDTTTSDGRLAARCLVAAGNGEREDTGRRVHGAVPGASAAVSR